MRTHPSKFPIFVYGTLMEGGLYRHLIQDYIESSPKATTRGCLYYKKFQPDESEKFDVTAAFTPVGNRTIQGTLLTPYDSEYYNFLSKLDELEFNFDCSDIRGEGYKPKLDGQHRLRVYLRDLISCTTDNGTSYLSWCYIYHPIISIPQVNLIPANNLGVTFFDKDHATQMLLEGKISSDYIKA